MPLVAGVDSSTQSTKVEVRDIDTGAVAGRSSAPHPPTTPPRSEQHPSSWWTAFEAAWAGSGAGSAAIGAISIAGQQHGMVALDVDRQVIRPAKLWNDTESAPDSRWLIDQLPGGAAAWAVACGSVPVAALTITKLSWLHRSEPAAWDRLAHVVLPHDWLTAQLTGRLTTDRGDASGTGYWSPAEGAYRWDLLAIVDPDRDWSAVVPEVLGPLETAGTWRGVTVAPGTGDNMAAALGLALVPGDVVISLGTSGTVYTLCDSAVADPSGSIAGFADAAGGFLPLACTLKDTKVTDSIGRLLGVDHEELDRLALASPPGADGLVLLPYFDGERTPNRPTATGLLSGLRSGVSREQLARAAFEGVACGLVDALDALRALVPRRAGRVLLVGGGARSAAYRQIIADLIGQEITVADADEAVATGAAVQAAAVLEQRPPAEIAAQWELGGGRLVEPGPGASAAADVRAAYASVRDLPQP
jgi:xylulokinase